MNKNSTTAKKYSYVGHLVQTKAVFLHIERLSELCALIFLVGSCQFVCFSLGSLWSFCHGHPHHNSHNAFPGKNNVKGIVLPADDTRQTAFSTTSSTSLFSNVDVFFYIIVHMEWWLSVIKLDLVRFWIKGGSFWQLNYLNSSDFPHKFNIILELDSFPWDKENGFWVNQPTRIQNRPKTHFSKTTNSNSQK